MLEGNRRIAALKAILNPIVVPAYEKRIRSLLGDANIESVELITVMVAPSREEAQPLLASLHTTQARRPWSPLRQAEFYRAQVEAGKRTVKDLIQEYPDVDIPRFVRM